MFRLIFLYANNNHPDFLTKLPPKGKCSEKRQEPRKEDPSEMPGNHRRNGFNSLP